MKCILRNYGVNMTAQQRQVARSQAQDMVIARGTGRTPAVPIDLVVQSGPRGILLNWRAQHGYENDIAGWRIYKDSESKLYAQIQDPHTTQWFVATSSSASPSPVNLFVSAISKLGKESPIVMVQGTPTAEASVPSMPTTPESFTKQYTYVKSGGFIVA